MQNVIAGSGDNNAPGNTTLIRAKKKKKKNRLLNIDIKKAKKEFFFKKKTNFFLRHSIRSRNKPFIINLANSPKINQLQIIYFTFELNRRRWWIAQY